MLTDKTTIEERLKNDEEIQFANYILTNKNLYVIKKEKDGEVEYPLCPPIFAEKKYQNVKNNNVNIELKFSLNNRLYTEYVDLTILANPASWLASKGFFLATNVMREVQVYLMHQLRKAPIVQQYTDIGFIKNNKNDMLIGLSKPIGDASDTIEWNAEQSVADISLKGTYKNWLTCIKKDVLGEIPLEFMLGVGASALIVGYYNRVGYDKDSLMLQLVGSSTTGKTTAAQLAISIFGPPIKGRNTLFQSFNGTQNAIPKTLGGNYGVPFLFDELSLSSQADLSKLVYTIGENREKRRLTEMSSFQEQATWATTVLMTGEHSLLEQTNQNLGLYVRLFEYAIDSWTRDAAHADSLKQSVQGNYGHAGILYANYLAQDFAHIEEVVEEWKCHFKEEIPAVMEKDRIAEKYAFILAGLSLLGEALDITFHLDEVAAFVLSREKELAKKRDIADVFYEELIQDVCQTSKQFIIGNVDTKTVIVKGKITLTSDGKYYQVNYLKEPFRGHRQ